VGEPSQKTSNSRKVRMSLKQKRELENLDNQIEVIRRRIADYEILKWQEVSNLLRVISVRASVWQGICRELKINPLKKYRIKDDGEVVEIKEVKEIV